jgi:hypothetical protein
MGNCDQSGTDEVEIAATSELPTVGKLLFVTP